MKGDYIAIGSLNGHLVYKKNDKDLNDSKWYFWYDLTEDRWKFTWKATTWADPGRFDENLLGYHRYEDVVWQRQGCTYIISDQGKIITY